MENYGEYGREAELAVMDFLKSKSGFKSEHADANEKRYTGDYPGHMGMGPRSEPVKKMDVHRSRYGDVVIDFPGYPLKMNVVRGTWVSHTAVDRFKGHLYCMFPDGDIQDPGKGRVILSSTLKNYWNTCKNKQRPPEYISGKEGFRYRNLKAFMPLEDFNTHLTKMILMGIDMEYDGSGMANEYKNQSRDFWSTLKDPFIKDYKLKFQEAAANR